MSVRRPALAALGALLLSATPVLATGPAAAPTFARSEAWLTCANQTTKLYQANWAASVNDPSSYVGWDSTAPTQSVQSGAGCGGLDTGTTTNQVYDVPLRGTFTGNLREVTVTLNQLVTQRLRSSGAERLRLTGDIDGVPIFPAALKPGSGRTVTVTPTASSSGASESMSFTITGLGSVDADGTRRGVAVEDGAGAEQHVLTLFIGLDATSTTDERLGAWAWDTVETPSGLVFNPPATAAATVAADTPVLPTDEDVEE